MTGCRALLSKRGHVTCVNAAIARRLTRRVAAPAGLAKKKLVIRKNNALLYEVLKSEFIGYI
jgi:hypothetical protein